MKATLSCSAFHRSQGLVKNLLDVADNLERAAGSIPEADLAEGSEVDRDRALQLLRSLRDGVLMTDTVLMKVGGGLKELMRRSGSVLGVPSLGQPAFFAAWPMHPGALHVRAVQPYSPSDPPTACLRCWPRRA